MTICWTSDDCDGQVDLKLHLSVGKVILCPYFDHCPACLAKCCDQCWELITVDMLGVVAARPGCSTIQACTKLMT